MSRQHLVAVAGAADDAAVRTGRSAGSPDRAWSHAAGPLQRSGSRASLRAVHCRPARASVSAFSRTLRTVRLERTLYQKTRSPDAQPIVSQSPACSMTRRSAAGTTRAPMAATSTARGEATRARSARLKRHFWLNSARRAARRSWTPVQPCSSGTAARPRRRSSPPRIGEAQAVAGHRIDEARGIAGEQQPVHAGARRRRRRAVRARPADPRARASAARSRSSGSRSSSRESSAAGSRSSASPGRDGRTRQTLVSPPGIGATPMYRPRRMCISPQDRRGQTGSEGVRQVSDPICKVLVVGADGPAAGARRVTRQAEAERDRGVTSVGGDGDPRGERLRRRRSRRS